MIAAFSGTGKPYVHTGGLWIHGPSDDLTEDTPFNPPAIVAWREGVESRLAAADLALTIVEPGIVHGHGAGIPAMPDSAPRDAEGRLTVIGDGTPHWATVHVDDLAELTSIKKACELLGRPRGSHYRAKQLPVYGPAPKRPTPPNALTAKTACWR